MTGVELKVENRRFLRACSAGLSEKTAIVELSVNGRFTPNALLEKRTRTRASALCPDEPLFGITERDWPSAFLVAGDDPHAPGADAEALLWLGNWVVALTVAIQRWGRDPVWRGRVCRVDQGRVRLAIPWFRPSFFDEALSAALQLIPDWLESGGAEPVGNAAWLGWLTTDRGPVSELHRHFGDRWDEIQAGGVAPITLRFIEAAVRRGMPFDVLAGVATIGWGANAERFEESLTGQTSGIAVAIAENKYRTIQTLADAKLPTPRTRLVANAVQAQEFADRLGWPVVIKPVDQDGGDGVVTGIRDSVRLLRAFEQAERFSPGRVVVEQHYPGDDHRILIVRGQVLQVVRRPPTRVVGDGVHTNPGTGGTGEDVSAIAHPDNIALTVRAARVMGLDIASIDFLSPDISRSWLDVGGVICDINGQRALQPHWLVDPTRDIHGEVLNLLFEGRPARIPTAAITGTNGKSTTAEMLYRIWTETGRVTGVCTTLRLRVGDHVVSTDNLSGQPGARVMLNDPAVQAAVMEMPRKGLIIFGHPCDHYDVAALLNVQDDHIGEKGIDTAEQMAELKAEVLERATEAIVVNAEDPLCMAMRTRAGTGRHILVARTPEVPAVAEHRRQGGEAVYIGLREGIPWIVLAAGESDIALMPVHDIPATMSGLLTYNESNALFAAALAWAQGIDIGVIRRALSRFENTEDQNPGRYNFITGLPFDVLVDFAHNPDGVRGICSVASAVPVAGRRLLASLSIGDRHPHHIDDVASVLAATFDEFIISCDPEELGARSEHAEDDPAASWAARYRALLLQQGVDSDAITCELDRFAAIHVALDKARPGDLVVILTDHHEAQRVLHEWRAKSRP